MSTPPDIKHKFQSPYSEYKERNGQAFKIIEETSMDDSETHPDDSRGVGYKIEFADGMQIIAWPEEVINQ